LWKNYISVVSTDSTEELYHVHKIFIVLSAMVIIVTIIIMIMVIISSRSVNFLVVN
jgi:hypothetical protein